MSWFTLRLCFCMLDSAPGLTNLSTKGHAIVCQLLHPPWHLLMISTTCYHDRGAVPLWRLSSPCLSMHYASTLHTFHPFCSFRASEPMQYFFYLKPVFLGHTFLEGLKTDFYGQRLPATVFYTPNCPPYKMVWPSRDMPSSEFDRFPHLPHQEISFSAQCIENGLKFRY